MPYAVSPINRPPSDALKPSQLSMTQQNFLDEADINNIMDRYQKTGILLPEGTVRTRMPKFGDYRGINYQAAQDVIVRSNQLFDALPSSIRDRFNNSAAKLIEFCQQESNRDEAIKLGILTPEEPQKPQIDEKPVLEPVKSNKRYPAALKAAIPPTGKETPENPSVD